MVAHVVAQFQVNLRLNSPKIIFFYVLIGVIVAKSDVDDCLGYRL